MRVAGGDHRVHPVVERDEQRAAGAEHAVDLPQRGGDLARARGSGRGSSSRRRRRTRRPRTGARECRRRGRRAAGGAPGRCRRAWGRRRSRRRRRTTSESVPTSPVPDELVEEIRLQHAALRRLRQPALDQVGVDGIADRSPGAEIAALAPLAGDLVPVVRAARGRGCSAVGRGRQAKPRRWTSSWHRWGGRRGGSPACVLLSRSRRPPRPGSRATCGRSSPGRTPSRRPPSAPSIRRAKS